MAHYYVTKHALTKGIQRVEGEEVGNNMLQYTERKFTNYAHGEGRDWHRSRKSAVSRAEGMRLKKIESLQGQIQRLTSLKF